MVGKIHAFENCDGLSAAKWAPYIRALFIFLASHFWQWPILLFFAQDIVSLKVYNKIVKK